MVYPYSPSSLRNRLTKADGETDAIWQYKRDRNPREPPLQAWALRGALCGRRERGPTSALTSKGRHRGSYPSTAAGGGGLAIRPTRTVSRRSTFGAKSSLRSVWPTSWRTTRSCWLHRDAKTGKKKKVQIWPRFQQLDVVRPNLLAGRTLSRSGEAIPDPALGRQWQELFDRLAGSSVDPAGSGRQARLRLDHCRPPTARILDRADPRHDPAVRPSRLHCGACRAVR